MNRVCSVCPVTLFEVWVCQSKIQDSFLFHLFIISVGRFDFLLSAQSFWFHALILAELEK